MNRGHSNARSSSRQEFRALWSGPRLSVYEELCLASLVSRGQRVQLFSYETNLQVPDGVELCNANEILPGRLREFVYPNGDRSLALHSDLFRYEVVRRFGGWYIDLDMILLRDDPPSDDVYLAYETEELINSAVMRFPAGSPLMVVAAADALNVTANDPWGTAGPHLITRLVQEHQLTHHVHPRCSAFAIDSDQTCLMFLPQHREELEARVADSDFVHLWHEVRRRARILDSYGPPEGSFLDLLFRRFGFRFPAHGRLSPDAVMSWFQEYEGVNQLKGRLGTKLLTPELAADLHHTLLQRDQLLVERDDLRKSLEQLHASTSWRMTALPRAIVHRWREPAVTKRSTSEPVAASSAAPPEKSS